MIKHRYIERICCTAVILALIVTVLLMAGSTGEVVQAGHTMGYEDRLFDKTSVHSIDIVMNDWDGFIDTCTNEEYTSCNVVIDGEAYKNAGIRAKGNTSLSSVTAYGNGRYSFKIEFDKYNKGSSYYGLDKLCLNNIIQDNTYLKDYLCYTMMGDMGIASPLCSFVAITVNGEEWGLYLAVEGVEEGFLQRNYGSDYGELYKPDSMSFGGGRGNGMNFDMDELKDMQNGFDPANITGGGGREVFGGNNGNQIGGEAADGNEETEVPRNTGGPGRGQMEDINGRAGKGMGGGMGSEDVKLQYINDDPDSYPNIFNNAKTDASSADEKRLIKALKNLSSGESIEATVDTEAVIRYLVVHNFVCNGDSYTGSMVHNYYLYEKEGILSMIPWDYNLAFGGFGMGGEFGSKDSLSGCTSEVNSPVDSPVQDGDVSSRPMVAWIFENEEYLELYHRYYSEFVTEYFDSGYFEQMLDDVIQLISPYVEKDPTAFCTYEEFRTGAAALREFCLLRAESVSGQLEGAIPSTSDDQSIDSSALVDASHISASDMGQFASGGGRNNQFPAWQNDQETTGDEAAADAMVPEQSGDDTGRPDMKEMAQNREGEGFSPPGMGQGEFDPSPAGKEGVAPVRNMQGAGMLPSGKSLIVLGVSVLVLAGGIVCVKLYRR